MTDQTQAAPEAAPEPITVVSTGGTEAFHSPSDAGRALAQHRAKLRQADTGAEPAADQPQESPAQAEDAAPPEQEVTGETQEADPAPEAPPLERPRSWSKERDDAWKALDRDTQQYLLDHDREASSTVRKAQNEAAEKLKGLTAKEQAVEQARQQYESALPLLLNNLQSAMSGEFSDIKSMADVQKLATEDWPRYIRWDAQQKQIAATQQEIQTADARRTQENTQQWTEFAKKQDDEFLRAVPEMADPDKAAKLQKSAVSLLTGIGFSEQELADSYHGKLGFSARDHRFQVIVRKAVAWDEAQQRAKVVSKKPVPPVQRPGVSQPRGAALEADIQALKSRLEKSGNLKDAAALLSARRKAAR